MRNSLNKVDSMKRVMYMANGWGLLYERTPICLT